MKITILSNPEEFLKANAPIFEAIFDQRKTNDIVLSLTEGNWYNEEYREAYTRRVQLILNDLLRFNSFLYLGAFRPYAKNEYGLDINQKADWVRFASAMVRMILSPLPRWAYVAERANPDIKNWVSFDVYNGPYHITAEIPEDLFFAVVDKDKFLPLGELSAYKLRDLGPKLIVDWVLPIHYHALQAFYKPGHENELSDALLGCYIGPH